MSEIRQPNFFQVLEARIALALAKAGAAAAGIASLAHNTSVVNASTVGPAATITFTAPSFTPVSGKVLVIGSGVASGGTMVAGDLVSGILTRDGATIPGSGAPFTAVAAEGSPVAATIFGPGWIDTVTPNTAHLYGIQAAIGGGHTASFSPGQAAITLIELPIF